MNIFWLSVRVILNAMYHSDQHVVKMPLEAVQMLYTVKWLKDPSGSWQADAPWNKTMTARGYKATHHKHPIVVWLQQSLANYMYCVDYALALCQEYTTRFSTVRKEKHLHVEEHARWLKANPPANFLDIGMTPVPMCIKSGEVTYEEDLNVVVQRYREYYIAKGVVRYNHGPKPDWLRSE